MGDGDRSFTTKSSCKTGIRNLNVYWTGEEVEQKVNYKLI